MTIDVYNRQTMSYYDNIRGVMSPPMEIMEDYVDQEDMLYGYSETTPTFQEYDVFYDYVIDLGMRETISSTTLLTENVLTPPAPAELPFDFEMMLDDEHSFGSYDREMHLVQQYGDDESTDIQDLIREAMEYGYETDESF